MRVRTCGQRACANPASHGSYCFYHRESLRARLRWWLIHDVAIGAFVFWKLIYPSLGMLCPLAHPSGRCDVGCRKAGR